MKRFKIERAINGTIVFHDGVTFPIKHGPLPYGAGKKIWTMQGRYQISNQAATALYVGKAEYIVNTK